MTMSKMSGLKRGASKKMYYMSRPTGRVETNNCKYHLSPQHSHFIAICAIIVPKLFPILGVIPWHFYLTSGKGLRWWAVMSLFPRNITYRGMSIHTGSRWQIMYHWTGKSRRKNINSFRISGYKNDNSNPRAVTLSCFWLQEL